MNEKILFIFLFSLIFMSCNSTKLLPDDGIRTDELERVQTEIRTGENEIGISIGKLESAGEGLEDTIRKLESTSEEIKNSVAGSNSYDYEFGKILQDIERRKITREQLIEIGIDVDEIEKSEN